MAPVGTWRGLVADPDHGPLPAVLLVLTFVTGVVDAVSILSLGRVFVANMTGNVVFVGFALAGAAGFSLAASLSALAGFVVGALAGGRLIVRFPSRAALIRAGLAVETGFLVVALVVAAVGLDSGSRDVVAAAAAVAMGTQNSVVRALKVPDLTTTVLTLTLTGIASDIRTAPRAVLVRRILAVATMLVGAVVGALLVLHADPAAGLGLAVWLLILALAAVARTASWS
ncbi:YoaK family protein [Acidothermaceae bacterium B102]|nr:YoaK family protein [Acidothermaceae bacterium B102]